MAVNKKYYWLKLKQDFFSSKRIKKLRRLEKGDTCLIIYLKMQLKSINNDGIITYYGLEDTFEEELALDLDEDVDDVVRTVKFLVDFGLAEINENEYIFPYAISNTGSETAAAERMREFRKKQSEHTEEQRDNNVQKSNKEVPKKEKKQQKSETMLQLYDRLTENGEKMQSSMLNEKMKEWMKYKTERKETYKETGLATLIRQTNKYAGMFGDKEVCDLIDKSMSSNWAGIFWEKLEQSKVKTKQERITTRVSEVDNW